MWEWSDPKVHRLYSLVTTSRDGNMRRAALMFLGALERAGSKDAAWAMNVIRKQSKEGDREPFSLEFHHSHQRK